jgi:hypothetical protein
VIDSYGVNTLDKEKEGNWTITNGHLRFDVNLTVDESIQKFQARHPGPEHYIVSPKEADEYADKIVDALNLSLVQLDD